MTFNETSPPNTPPKPDSHDPLGDGKSLVEYVDHLGADRTIVRSARVSFANDQADPDEDRDRRLIRFLIENNHASPLEHCHITFHISCPLVIRAQWARHRTWPMWSLNEVSRRYTDEGTAVYVPKEWRGQSESNRQASEGLIEDQNHAAFMYDWATQRCLRVYGDLLKMGVAKELARMVLPQGSYTRFYATANLRNVMNFCFLRDHADAQDEIVAYARAISTITAELFPVAWAAFEQHKEGRSISS